MLKRISEIESTLRDSRRDKIEIQFPQFTNDNLIKGELKLTFTKFGKELIELILVEPEKIDLYDDIEEDYISHVKAFETKDGMEISLDPYDESIEAIEDRDNYVFRFKGYKIRKTKI